MRLIDKQSINTKLFKADDIILAGLIVQLVQSRLYLLSALFKLLDGHTLAALVLEVCNGMSQLVDLGLQEVLHE